MIDSSPIRDGAGFRNAASFADNTTMNYGRILILMALLIAGPVASCGLVDKASGRETYVVQSASMEPTLKKGSRGTARLTRGNYVPNEGDIVVFRAPASWSRSEWKQAGTYISRVIGIPGDSVSCCNSKGQMVVNGHPLVEPYVTTNPASALSFGPVNIGRGRLWIQGDNRNISLDSRAHRGDSEGGTIGVTDVIGVIGTSVVSNQTG
ncbi:signal peptidase I [Microtetraspora glauca]|uniref:Signal peptidase I n=1 Tax=Microtetraspora glauca TaxID=1996 RepID=A0ABV3GJ24_MICGL